MRNWRWKEANLFLAAMMILLIALAGFCPETLAQEKKVPRGGTLKMIYQEPTHLNMAIVSGTPTGVPGTQIFAGLLQFDEKFQPRPYLATKWDISPDGRTYTFHLQKGATFHDGKPITSADVAFSLEIVSKNHPFGVAMFRAVDKVDTSDPHVAVFKLKHPYPAFLAAMHPLLLPIIPKHVYGQGEIRQNPANIKPIGSGPFKFVEWKKGQHIILERNPDFFRKGQPYLDRIIIEFINDPAARTVALETGATDFVPYSYIGSPEDIRRLEKVPHLATTTKGYEAIGARAWFAINVRKPPLNNPKVRKAIAHLMDKDFIVNDILMGIGKAATGPFRYTNPFYNPNVQKYEYNLNKANQLLDEAGFKKGADGTRFALNLDWIPGAATNQSTCEYLKEQLKKVGINATLRPVPDFPSWAAKTSKWDFDLNMDVVFDYPDPVIGIERMYISQNIKNLIWTNTMGYNNPEVDRLFAEAQVEQNLEKRKKMYNRVQEILVDELPILWFLELEYYSFYHKDFDGMPLDVWGPMNPYDTMYWKKGK
jgi:peptide/nickel transport system substrate-binding protein